MIHKAQPATTRVGTDTGLREYLAVRMDLVAHPTGGRQAPMVFVFHAAAALALALLIFALDVISPLQGAVAVLYTVVVVIAARPGSRSLVLAAGGICSVLALTGFVISHGSDPLGSAAMRLGVSLVAVLVTSLLSAGQISSARAQRDADARYATIFDAAGFPIWESDWSGAWRLLQGEAAPGPELVQRAFSMVRVRNANHQAARFFGYRARTEMIGISIARHFAAGGAVSLEHIFNKLLQGENPVEVETQFVDITGNTLDAVLRISLPPDSHGWDRVLITALDVTERNRAQQRLAESHAELTHMARVMTLGQIAASIAHEVNQPLSAVINYAKSGRRWLQREAPDALEVRDCLEQIAHNGERAAGVIAGIRELTRKSDPVRGEVDINRIFAETTALLVRDLRSAGVDLRGDLARDLPGILADRVQIQQILMNLILNASHAMADTEGEDRIVLVAAHPVGDRLDITVSDRGTGLNGKDPEALFQPFFTTKTRGMGMGLTICRSIIEQHGGTLVAEQNPGGGLVMRFDLPLFKADERTQA